eukprot:2173336-Prymnesium_polylepis.1
MLMPTLFNAPRAAQQKRNWHRAHVSHGSRLPVYSLYSATVLRMQSVCGEARARLATQQPGERRGKGVRKEQHVAILVAAVCARECAKRTSRHAARPGYRSA